MEETNCSLCGSNNTIAIFRKTDNFSKENFPLVRCQNCKLLYVNPRPSKDEIWRYCAQENISHCKTEGRQTYGKIRLLFRKIDKQRRELIKRNILAYYYNYKHLGQKSYPLLIRILIKLLMLPYYLSWIITSKGIKVIPFYENGRLLEVGCSTGNTLKELNILGWDTYGIDIDKERIEVAAKKGLKVFVGELLEARFPDAFFNVVYVWHTLEHIYDPVGTIREIYRILGPKGKIIIATPNTDSIEARWFKEDWVHFDLPRHVCMYTPATLKQLLNRSNFKNYSISYYKDDSGLKVGFTKNNKFFLINNKALFNFVCNLFNSIFALIKKSGVIVVSATKESNFMGT